MKTTVKKSNLLNIFLRQEGIKKWLLKCSFLCILFLLSPSLFSAPYNGNIIQLQQPDGSLVNVKIFGDEYYVRIESLEGYTLIRDEDTRWICYAELNEDGSRFVSTKQVYKNSTYSALRSMDSTAPPAEKGLKLQDQAREEIIKTTRQQLDQADQDSFTTRSTPVPEALLSSTEESRFKYHMLGEKKGLTLLINFPDETSVISYDEINDFCNKTGYTGYGNNGSIRDYFKSISGDKLDYTNYVTAFYTAKYSKSYYTDPDIAYGQRARELVKEALNWLEEQGFDFSTLSTDSYSRILAINALYAGYSGGGWSEGLWPHASTVTGFSADGVSSYRYQITNIGSNLQIRTFCHENGHMLLRWPDLYDYGSESTGVGNYCLMGYGGSNTNPVPANPYFRWIAGWETMQILNDAAGGTVFTSTSGDFTSFQYINPTLSSEFFVVDSIYKTGRYTAMPDEGLLIWHIDEFGSNNNEQMTPTLHYKVSVEQADGLFKLEAGKSYGEAGNLFHQGYKTTFNDNTEPDALWWSGDVSGLSISNIGPVGPEMLFTYNGNGNSNEPAILKWAYEEANTDGAWNWSMSWQNNGSTIETGNQYGDLPTSESTVFEGNSALKIHITHNGTGSAGGLLTTAADGTGNEAGSLEERDGGKDLSRLQYLRFYCIQEPGANADLSITLLDVNDNNSNSVHLSTYGAINDSTWQGVLIPLADFNTSLIDISAVKSINISLPGGYPAGDYCVYLDNISFVKPGDSLTAPVANAGPDQVVQKNEQVRLDGSASYDSDMAPGPLRFLWSQVSGPGVTLSNTTSVNPSFIASESGTYVFSLTLDDGLTTVSDTVTVTVEQDSQVRRIAIKSGINNKYVCAENGGNDPLVANRDGVSGWEIFLLIPLADGKYALKAEVNNQYVAAELDNNNILKARSSEVSLWEEFYLEDLGNGQTAIKSAANGLYVANEMYEGNRLRARSNNGSGSWEAFVIEYQ